MRGFTVTEGIDVPNKRHFKDCYSLSIFVFLLLSFTHPINAIADQGHGRVNVQGSIVEVPCAIDTQSRDQSVDMGVTPTAVIARDGRGISRPFHIRLVNCHLARLDTGRPDWRFFRATFDGDNERDLFALAGTARGVALELVDSEGSIAHPGLPLPPGTLVEGEQQLNYTLRLVGNRKALDAGSFRTTLRFRMDYY